MRKSAMQKWNETCKEVAETRAAAKSFSDKKLAQYNSHSYAAGYLESLVVELIMQLPKAKRAQYRDLLSMAN